MTGFIIAWANLMVDDLISSRCPLVFICQYYPTLLILHLLFMWLSLPPFYPFQSSKVAFNRLQGRNNRNGTTNMMTIKYSLNSPSLPLLSLTTGNSTIAKPYYLKDNLCLPILINCHHQHAFTSQLDMYWWVVKVRHEFEDICNKTKEKCNSRWRSLLM